MHHPRKTFLAGLGIAVIGLAIGVGAALAAGPHGAIAPARPASAVGGSSGAGGYAGGAGPGGGGQASRQATTVALTQPIGSLTAEQAGRLAATAQEEQLAFDVYTIFGQQYATPVWTNIAASEAAHLSAVRTLLDRYGIEDPTAGRSSGDFASLAVTNAYRAALAQGNSSEAGAWAAGAAIEDDDLAKLDAAAAGVTAPDVSAVYAALHAASEQHAASFARLLGS